MSDICNILSTDYGYNIGYDKTLQKDLDTNIAKMNSTQKRMVHFIK